MRRMLKNSVLNKMAIELLNSGIIEPYTPKNFGKDFFELRGSSQYPMFIAAVLGLKPLFDDWVSVNNYSKYIDVCRKYGLLVETDMVFSRTNTSKKDIVGGENINTTFFEGKKFADRKSDDEIHVFVSKDRNSLVEAKKFGWYPLVINNRSINRPYINGMHFGKCLGYPDCCIDFFRKYNNWHLYSCPYEIYKNTKIIKGKAVGSYYCNSFLMDNTYSYIHHFPCSYRCRKTIDLGKEIEKKISEIEPEFIDKTKKLLKMPLLVFNEKNFIIFDGVLSKDGKSYGLNYALSQYISNPFRPEETIDFYDSIRDGSSILMQNNEIIVRSNSTVIKKIRKKPEWFMTDFD